MSEGKKKSKEQEYDANSIQKLEGREAVRTPAASLAHACRTGAAASGASDRCSSGTRSAADRVAPTRPTSRAAG